MSANPAVSAVAAPHFAPKRSVPELLDAAINLVRPHYSTLVTVSAIAFLPSLLLAPIAHLVPRILPNVLSTLCAGYAEACLLLAAAALYRGEPLPSVAQLLGNGRRIGWRVIGIAVVRSIATVLGLILLIVPGLLAFAHYALGTPVAAIEGRPAGQSMKRGGALARGEKGRILGVFVLTGLVFLLLLVGIGVVIGMVTQSAPVMYTATLVLQIGAVPVFSAISVMLYYDIRERREGLDIEWALGGPTQAAPVLES